MIRSILGAAGLAALYGVASAAPVLENNIDHSGYDIYVATRADTRGSGVTYYSDMQPGPDGYVAFPDTPLDNDGELEVAGIADYTSTSVSNITIDTFKFFGGVDQFGGVVFIDFFDAGGIFIDGFGVQLHLVGSFFWTISMFNPLTIADAGFVQISIDDEGLFGSASSQGRWFLGNNGADIGDAGTPEASPDFNFNFELGGTVPTPGALALLGLGGLAASRRRR